MFLPPPQAPQDLFRRVQCFAELPGYDSYLKCLASLPAPSESGWDLSWPFPSPPVLDFDRALPGYVSPYMQSLTPLGGGSIRRSAPWPPPRREKPLKAENQSESQPEPSRSACHTYQELPDPQADPEAFARTLASRLAGEPARVSALCSNQETRERLIVYSVLREDSKLRYNVDKRRFFQTLSSGATCDLLSLARAGQMLRQGRLKPWLALLPYEQHLFTPAPPRPPKRAPLTVNPPPAPTPTPAPTAAPTPSPVEPNPAPSLVTASIQTPSQPVATPVAVQAPTPPAPAIAVPTAPFKLKIHRYWDLAAGDYSEVSEVYLEGKGCEEEPLLNSEKLPTFLVDLNLPVGASVKVTAIWANGVRRSWEEHLSLDSGVETEVYSPEG